MVTELEKRMAAGMISKDHLRSKIDEVDYVRRCVLALKGALRDASLGDMDTDECLERLVRDCNITLDAYHELVRECVE